MYDSYPPHIYFTITFLAEVFSTYILHFEKSADKIDGAIIKLFIVISLSLTLLYYCPADSKPYMQIVIIYF